MSYEDGWSAMHLEMPKRVPRTEYSVHAHWDLVRVVTGLKVDANSPFEERDRASDAFIKAWNYDCMWQTLIGRIEFGPWATCMGHAEYASGGVDKNVNVHCPYPTPEDVLAFDAAEKLERRDPKEITRRFERHYQDNCRRWPNCVNMTGIYVSCISGLIDLFGWEMLLLAAGTDPEGMGQVTNRYATWVQQYFDALAASNVPVVMVHDDIVWTAGAFIAPAWYRQYVFPNLKKLIRPLRDAGKIVLFTSDGTYTQFIDDIAGCGVNGFVMEPTTDMQAIAEKYGKTHVFIGNADTRALMTGSKADIRAEVERCMRIGKRCPGFFMCVGNHIPPNTPVESALYYNQVYTELSRR